MVMYVQIMYFIIYHSERLSVIFVTQMSVYHRKVCHQTFFVIVFVNKITSELQFPDWMTWG